MGLACCVVYELEDSPALVVIQGEHERPAKRIDGEEYSFIVYKNY